MDLLLGIDVGTTSVKAGLFTTAGSCLALQRHEYQLDTPRADRAQLDANLYWQACINTIRRVVTQIPDKSDKIIALSVSSQGETTITVDKDGNPIYPALVWLDNRAESQSKCLAKIFSASVYEYTGIPEVIPTWPACKILWIKENEPEVFIRVQKFLLVQDFIVYRLTGKYVTNGSISCTTMYFDIIKNKWWDEVLSFIGITPEYLPEVVQSGTPVGTIADQVAEELGLSADTLVIAGGMDQAVGALGAGNYQSGPVSETTGGALSVQATTVHPMLDRNKRIPVYLHCVSGKYLFVPVCPTGGMMFKWFRDNFAEDSGKENKNIENSYDRLTKLAATIPAGSDGLVALPHLMGAFSPEVNPYARGSFTGFTLSHTRAHFARAIMEGVAFLLKRNLEYLKQIGISFREIISTGGGARSKLWIQIKADVCNIPVVTLVNEETALLGNALLAGVAGGAFKTIEEGCQSMVVRKEVVQPDQDSESYVQFYARYCHLDQVLTEYFKDVYEK